jgi:hypothetical protein
MHSCKFHSNNNWTEICRSTFLQIYTNHVINLMMLLKNTEMRSYKFSQPCKRKTHEGIPSKFLWSWWFSPCAVVLLGPSLHGPTSISLLPLYTRYICVRHWCWVVAPITWNFIGCENPVSGLVMVVVTLSCHATWPFSPWTHLNSSVTIIDWLYIVFHIGVGW